ncbi:Coiled-coil domain-containing protein [Echinococcus granulosus]|uniref:Coiled-coil domain-containing protein n=1 Tax=Echinococcus granulosus TaxID=6210 RepID=W6UQG7_ECHGR|nr:Coiled-coil domain-containing protein [Echinococcus granulosus]EUB62976.1 Coiled-coil domain-containing protein [Echinococcus granulosus]
MTACHHDKNLLKGVVKPAIDESSFNQLCEEYNSRGKLLGDLKGNKLLRKFCEEYEKIMAALQKSHENEKKLMRKCRELKADILSNSVRLDHVEKISSENPANLSALKKELESAWTLVEGATGKENQARERIKRLKEEIATLSNIIEKGGSGEVGADAIAELSKNLEKLTKEKSEQAVENAKLREQIDSTKEQINGLQEEIFTAQQKIAELGRDIQEKASEAQRELRKKEKMEREMNDVGEEVELKHAQIRSISEVIEKLQEELKVRQEENRTLRISYEQMNRKLQLAEAKLADAQSKLDAQVALTESIRAENASRSVEVKQKEEEVEAIRAENAKLVRQNEAASRRIRSIEEKKQELERTRDRLRENIAAIDRDLEATRKTMDNDRKACEELTRERDALSKSLFKVRGQAAKQTNLLRLHEQSKQNLEREITNYNQEAITQRKIINVLENERDHYLREASSYTQKVLNLMEEVKFREMQIFDFRKKIAEAQTKLKQQENLYEAIKSDRNLYSKNLIEAQDEISGMKRKLHLMAHRISQLKEEIANTDAMMVQETAECVRMTRERDNMQKELQRMKNMAIENRSIMESQEAEERKLLKVIAQAEFERTKHRKELDQVISEKDILGIQLVRRNDDLANLYEKIRIQKSVLDKGEAQFNKVLGDLRRVREEICATRREKAMLQANATKMDELKREVIKARKELSREQVRCKALEDELKKPINVHRWRKLEGSDPSSFEMIKKIHSLQKRLIGKTEEVLEKEIQIQKKERLYVELKQVLARQPGPEIAEQLAIYENSLREKLAAMKIMTAQMEKHDASIKDYKLQMEKLDNELLDTKKAYFEKRRLKEGSRARTKFETPEVIVEKASEISAQSESEEEEQEKLDDKNLERGQDNLGEANLKGGGQDQSSPGEEESDNQEKEQDELEEKEKEGFKEEYS